MPYADIDRLLREERFDELARLSAIPASRLIPRKSRGERLRAWVRSALTPARVADAGPVTIRHARPEDGAAVARLAEMEERAAPRGPILVAEVERQILAALPLDGSAAVTHPWRQTAGLVDLLELRSRQLDREVERAA
jgi:hypothetical protein